MDNPRVIAADCCKRCQDERQVFGVAMEHATGGLTCPECGHFEARRSHPMSVDPFAERELREEIHECYAEDASRRGRCVPETATGGGDACGEAKDKVNPFKWMRRGA